MSSPVAEAGSETGQAQTGPDTGQAGVRVWAGAVGGIVLWMVHITALASLIELTCERPVVEWVLHLVTAVTAGLTLLGMWWCLALVRQSRQLDAVDDRDGRRRFLGLFGLMMGGSSVLLILWEGSYVFFLDPCA